MRRLILPVAAVLALVASSSAPAKSLFVVTGRGWGHGVGLSQWGAYGLARNGWTYQQIVGHYYRNTTLDARSPTKRVSVLLADGRTSLSVGSAASFTVSDGTRTRTHAAGYPVGVTKTSTGRIRVEGINKTFSSPATISSSSPLRLGSSRYRGTLRVSVVGGRLRAVNRVGIDAYVRGVVTRESPAWWGDVGAQAAIAAQAVVARSYALYTVAHGGGKCAGHLCPDVRDQVYGGYDSETANGNQAVSSTSGVVVEYNGGLAQTFFSSSSGGRTAASADVWNPAGVPYLQSENDPADLNSDNPNRLWRLRLSGGQMKSRLDLPRTPNDGTISRNSSDRVGSMTFSKPGWSMVVPGGDSLRWRMNVKSNRFWLGVLTLERRDTRIVYGQATTLDVIARGLSNMRLQSRPHGASAWSDISQVSGNVDVTLRPKKTTSYRLRSSHATGSALPISVAAKILFDVTHPAGALTGIVKPKSLAGQTVTVQKKVNGSWTAVATATVNAEGRFRANFDVKPGTYRARISPPASTGLLDGKSPTLTVS